MSQSIQEVKDSLKTRIATKFGIKAGDIKDNSGEIQTSSADIYYANYVYHSLLQVLLPNVDNIVATNFSRNQMIKALAEDASNQENKNEYLAAKLSHYQGIIEKIRLTDSTDAEQTNFINGLGVVLKFDLDEQLKNCKFELKAFINDVKAQLPSLLFEQIEETLKQQVMADFALKRPVQITPTLHTELANYLSLKLLIAIQPNDNALQERLAVARGRVVMFIASETQSMSKPEKGKYLQQLRISYQIIEVTVKTEFRKYLDSTIALGKLDAQVAAVELDYKELAISAENCQVLVQLKPKLESIQEALQKDDFNSIMKGLAALGEYLSDLYPVKSKEDIVKLLGKIAEQVRLPKVDSMDLYAKAGVVSDALMSVYQEYSSGAAGILDDIAMLQEAYSNYLNSDNLVQIKKLQQDLPYVKQRAEFITKLNLAKDVFFGLQLKDQSKALDRKEAALSRYTQSITVHEDNIAYYTDAIKKDKNKEHAYQALIKQANDDIAHIEVNFIKPIKQEIEADQQLIKQHAGEVEAHYGSYEDNAKQVIKEKVPLVQSTPKLGFVDKLKHVGNVIASAISNGFKSLGMKLGLVKTNNTVAVGGSTCNIIQGTGGVANLTGTEAQGEETLDGMRILSGKGNATDLPTESTDMSDRDDDDTYTAGTSFHTVNSSFSDEQTFIDEDNIEAVHNQAPRLY
jgi:hypothetical protein